MWLALSKKPLGRGEMESLKETKGSWRQQLTRHEMNKKKVRIVVWGGVGWGAERRGGV